MSFKKQRGSSSPQRQTNPAQDRIGRSTATSGLYIDHDPSSSSPSLPTAPSLDEPQTSSLPVFCLEWHTQTLKRRRRVLTEAREVRAEMTAGERPGVERLIVVRGVGGRIMETLRGAGGVDGAFLEAHVTRMEFRPSRRRDVGARWWCWEYPEAMPPAEGRRSGWRSPPPGASTSSSGSGGGCWDRDAVSLVRASLWLGPNVSILLINRPESEPPARYAEQVQAPPSLKHRDAATSPRTLQNGTNAVVSPTIAAAASTVNVIDHCLSSDTGGELETSVWDSIGEGLPYEELVGELVYERWTSFLESLGPRKHKSPGGVEELVLWASIKALEQNLDSARYLERQGRELDSLTYGDWADLIDRAGRRLTLLSTTSVPPQHGKTKEDRDQDDRDANKRALDRISYMGGLLLPLNVVGGILAMGKPYGPAGHQHWLFWLISLAASALAVIIIYVDQLRCLPVWIEMAAQDAIFDGHGHLHDSPAPSPDKKSRHRRHRQHAHREGDWSSVIRDEGGRAWRRERLGWGGAMKKITGYYRWSGGQGVQFVPPRGSDGLYHRY